MRANLGSTASVKWWGPIRTPPRHGAHRKLRYGSSTELVSPSIANLWRPKFCHPEHRPLPPASLRRNTCLRPEHPSSPLVGPRSNLSCWPSPPRSHLHRISAACDLRPDDSTTRRLDGDPTPLNHRRESRPPPYDAAHRQPKKQIPWRTRSRTPSSSSWSTSCRSASRASSLAFSACCGWGRGAMIHGADFACARSNQDIANQAVLEVSDRLLYDIENNRAPYRHGPLDPRLVRVKPHGPVCAVANPSS